MLLTEIDHVAIAVNDLEAAIDYYHDTFGCEVEHREVVETRRRRGGAVEGRRLLRPAAHADPSPTRTVAKYLATKGEGIHHVGYRVADCAAALESVKAHGPSGHRRGAPPGQPRHDRRVRAPEDGVRDFDRARPGVTCGPRCRSRFPPTPKCCSSRPTRPRRGSSRAGSRPRSPRPAVSPASSASWSNRSSNP